MQGYMNVKIFTEHFAMSTDYVTIDLSMILCALHRPRNYRLSKDNFEISTDYVNIRFSRTTLQSLPNT
jgi:hypothetical protein